MEADPSIVLEWLESANDELRELQLTALEQLCNEVLFSDNVDVFFERYPPRLFIPALCKIFLDELSPDSVLEANARALTYYLDVSLDCAPRIARSPNVLTAMTSRLDTVDMTSAKSNELGQQIIKMLQLICTREPGAVYASGGLTSVLRYVRLYPHLLHADVLQAGMDIIRRLFTRADPTDKNLNSWIDSLSSLLDRRETGVADQALHAFANLVTRFTRTGTDPSPLADPHIIDCLLQRLRVAGGVETDSELMDSSSSNIPTDTSGGGRDGLSLISESNPVTVHAVTNILTSLCCNSLSITHKLLTSDGQFAMTLAMVVQRSNDELVVISVLRLIEILLVLLYQTHNIPSKSNDSLEKKSEIYETSEHDICETEQCQSSKQTEFQTSVSIIEHAENSQNTTEADRTSTSPLEPQHSWEGDAVHRHFIEAIKRQDLDFMKCSLKSGKIDVNYMDNLGQTLLNWAASFGSPAMVELLCTHGANVNLGVRSPLDYAASFGRVDVCRTLLNWGADINKRDAQGRRPVDRAREHPDYPGSHQVIEMLESELKRTSLRGLSSKLDKSDGKQTTASSSLTSSANAHDDVDKRDSSDPAEAQRIFVNQLLPLLVGLFKESTSSSVRHQCTLLVWRMIHYMLPDHLETISLKENQSVPFAFSLTQMIYTILIEEREELILRALELSLRLLHKSPSIYILVFYRLGLLPLIKILVDILRHLLIKKKSTTGQQISLSSPIYSSDENEVKDMLTVHVSTVNTGITTTTTTTTTTNTTTISPSTGASTSVTLSTTVNTEATEFSTKENSTTSKVDINIEKQDVCTPTSKDIDENDNYESEMSVTPTTDERQQEEEEEEQPISPSLTATSEPVFLNAQLYNWNGWYFFCMGQLLSVFTGFAFITIQLQPEDGGLRALCIHHYGHRNSPIPIQLHPGENPLPRPGLKFRMLRMHQHLMELAVGNTRVIPLFQDVKDDKSSEEEAKKQTVQSTSVSQLGSNILGDSSLYNLETSRNNARRFRKRLGLRHDPISTHIAASMAGTVGSTSSMLQRQASSPARVCLTSRFSAKLPDQSTSTGSDGTTASTSLSFGCMICSLLKRKDGTYISVKPRLSSTCSSKPLFTEALLLSENVCSGFKRIRIASVSKEAEAAAPPAASAVDTELKSIKTISKPGSNPNELLKSTKRHSRSFLSVISQIDLPAPSSALDTPSADTTATTPITPAASASIYSRDIPEIFDFDSLVNNSDSLNIGMDYLQLCDESSSQGTDNDSKTNCEEKRTDKNEQMISATDMELSRIDKLFFPNEIIHETYNSGQLTVLLRPEDDDSRSEMAAERLVLIRKRMLTLSEKLLEKLQSESSSPFNEEQHTSVIMAKIGPIDGLNRIKKIVLQIWDAFKTDKYNSSTDVTLNKLYTSFQQLSTILHEGEQTVTAYELTTSGLIQVLLLCLSIAHAGRWHYHTFSMELDKTTALLCYLQERRRVFVQNILSSSRSKSMSLLVRRLVQAFELTEHLPLRIFSAAHLSRKCPSSSTTEKTSSDRTVVNSEVTAETKSEYAPSTVLDRIGYAASLPINFINSAFNRCQLTVCTDRGESVSISLKQPFQDSMDAKELSALLRFCPVLLDFPEPDSCLPSLHQIAKRLPLYLDKLSQPNEESSGNANKSKDSRRLYNWRGKALFVSPLTTVSQLERFLSRMSTKQWYECPRLDLTLWSQVHSVNSLNPTGLCFPAPPPGNNSADYLGGVIDWLATNGNRHPLEDWVNPAIIGLISVAASTNNPVKGRPVSILGPQAGALVGGYTIRGSGIGVVVKPKRMNYPNASNQNESRSKKNSVEQKSRRTTDDVQFVTETETQAWIAIDLGLQLVPTAYTLAYLRRADASEHSIAPRNWKLEASNDAVSWTVLREHTNDSSIHSVSGSRATWSIVDCYKNDNSTLQPISSTSNTACTNPTKGWRFYKIQTTGPNENGGKQLALGGVEFYGNVYCVHDSVLSASTIAQKIYSISLLSEKKETSSTLASGSSPIPIIKSPNTNQVNRISYTKSCATTDTSTTVTSHIQKSREKSSPNLLSKRTSKKDVQQQSSSVLSDCDKAPSSPQSNPIHSGNENVEEENDNDNVNDNDNERNNNPNTANENDDDDDDNDDDEDDDDDDDEDDDGDDGSVDKNVVDSFLGDESNDALMNILFDEEGSDDTLRDTDKGEMNINLRLCNKNLDDLNLTSSRTVDERFLQCFSNLLAKDKMTPELFRILQRIAGQDMNFSLSNKPASRSMDSLNASEDNDSTMIGRLDSVKKGNTGEINVTHPMHCIDQSNIETIESDPGLDYLLTSIEPEALEFADTVEAIICSNNVQNRQNNDDDDNQHVLDVNKPWRNIQPVPSNSKFSSNSVDDNQKSGKQINSSKQNNEVSSVTVNIPLDVSELPTSPSSWKSSTHQFRRRIRRPRPLPIVSPESRGTPASHSNSPCTGNPAVTLSWNEATDSLRLPLGLIPAFIPNPGSTNAPGTTAYVLCQPPSNEPVCTSKVEDSYSRLSLFLGIYMNSEYVIQIPLRDKNVTVFKYIQELSEKFEMLDDTSKYRLSKSMDGEEKAKNNYVIKLGYRFWDEHDNYMNDNDGNCSPMLTGAACTTATGENTPTIRTVYGHALLNKHDLRFTPSLDRSIKFISSGINIPVIGDNTDKDSDMNNEIDELKYTFFDYEMNRPYPPSEPEDILQLIKLLYQLSGLKEMNEFTANNPFTIKSFNSTNDNSSSDENESIEIRIQDFVSNRLTNKLLRQINDPLALASGALPNWCLSLSQRFSVIFSYDARSQLFSACAFGPARAAIWLQNRPLQKRTYGTNSDVYSRAGSANSTTGRSSYRLFLPSSNTSLISALLNNTITNSNSSNVHDRNNLSTNPNGDFVLLRPSILTHLLSVSSVNGLTNNNAQNDNIDINSDHISSLESILTSLGISLPSNTGSLLNCDDYLQDSNTNDLINCLLINSNHNGQHLNTNMTTATTTPNNGNNGGFISGFSSDDKLTSQIGRLLKEFVRIPRLPYELLTQYTSKCIKLSPNYYQLNKLTFWHWASRLMEEHASRKSELEIQFIGEEGTGLGPTLEFYSLLAAELRRRDGLMWVTDDFPMSRQTSQHHSALPTVSSSATLEEHVDSSFTNQNSVDNEIDDTDEASIYVNTPYGLFPAPWPGDRVPESVLYRFYILGITVAKCLQDNRRIDLPLSPSFLKLLSTYGSIVQQCNDHKLKSEKLEIDINTTNSSNRNIHSVNKNVNFSILSDIEGAFQNILYNYFSIEKSFNLLEYNKKLDIHDSHEFNHLVSFLLSPQYKQLYQCSKFSNYIQSNRMHWISGILNLNDFCLIYPERAKFMKQIVQFLYLKYKILMNSYENNINSLTNEIFGCDLDDLCISMEFLPPSKLFGFSAYPLQEYYSWESDITESTTSKNESNPVQSTPVSINNVEKYLELTLAFCLDKGIRKQIDAFKDGFQRVLPLHWLALFTGTELGQLISGDSVAQWTREDLLAYTVPSLGFTKQSPTYQMLINVLSKFNLAERRAFLQFTTGCSSLPPGGLKNLYPRLRIVRKELTNSGPYPSVNTCVHYLKLPEYQTEKELRTRLLQATKEIGFYLN